MKALKWWITAALACALAASLSLPSGLALTPEEPFADFRIDASGMDVPDRTLSVSLETHQQGESGINHTVSAQEYDCKINRVTRDAAFYIQPKVDGVRLTVNYLINLDGELVCEQYDREGNPVWDSVDLQSNLVRGGTDALLSGQTYILSAEALSARFAEAAQARAKALGLEERAQNLPLCKVTLSCTDPTDGQEYEQLYYLELYGSILLPSDISPGQWYYTAVEYGLMQGYFSGLEDGRFGPDEPLNRAQLAQVLWTMDGSMEAEQAHFFDVSSDDWFYQAVAWCRQQRLISGYQDGTFAPYAPLTREQLASILCRYARYSGANLRGSTDLSRYDDYEDISSWAYDSMQWAVANRLLTADGTALRPGDTVTRAELAAALYAYDINVRTRSMW